MNIEKEMEKCKKNKNNKIKSNKYNTKCRSSILKMNKKKKLTFEEEMEKIKNDIINDISECYERQKKDILILIDFNIYNNNISDLNKNVYIIDLLFLEKINIILNDYLSTSDRLCVLIYFDKYQIACPLMEVNNIDSNTLSKELLTFKNKVYTEKKDSEDSCINTNEYKDNFSDFNLDGNENDENQIINEFSQEEDSFISDDNEDINYMKLDGLLKAINYLIDYSKIKEGEKNEKYIIIFSDFPSMAFTEEEKTKKIFEDLKRDNEITFLLIRKCSNLDIKNDETVKNLMLSRFGEKSKIIEIENAKTIKEILSNNNIIRDEIVYPNEIYKQ